MKCVFKNCNKESNNNEVQIRYMNINACFCDTHLKEMKKDDLILSIPNTAVIAQ